MTIILDSALRYIRLPDRERIIGADAICINQQDLQEKGSQVEMMRNIYMTAVQVLVRLGEGRNAKVALRFLDVLDREKGRWKNSRLFSEMILDGMRVIPYSMKGLGGGERGFFRSHTPTACLGLYWNVNGSTRNLIVHRI